MQRYIINVGSYKELDRKCLDKFIDYQGKIITPGFVDTHVHYPQLEMTSEYGEQLIGWLNAYTFLTEMKFSNYGYASEISSDFLNQLIKNGTTTALVFATSSPVSVNAFFEQALKRNMRMITGKVLMDRNAPPELLNTPEKAYRESKELIEKWQNKGRLGYAVTPRFAPTSTEEELSVAGKLLKEYSNVYLHTHLAENNQEVDWVKELFPWSRSYLDVYDKFGLITKNPSSHTPFILMIWTIR
ncbi:amidohydrolase family protein [Ewingella sp. S1.OA.A_B6]